MKRILPFALGLIAVGVLAVLLTQVEAPTDAAVFNPDQTRSLQSLEKLSDHPLYVMHYYGSYQDVSYSHAPTEEPAWACTLFAAAGDPEMPVLGRNFDWPRHPVLILIADPPDAYASLSMVDLGFLAPEGIGDRIHLLSLDRLGFLLETPLWTFDGMNERGLTIGMAAVAGTAMPYDPMLPTHGSLEVMRKILDNAATVEEALDIFETTNVDMTGGPCLHYLVADASGESALIEYWDEEMYIFRTDGPWTCVTNYRLCQVDEADRPGVCWRFDAVHDELVRTSGEQDMASAMALLDAAHAEVSGDPKAGTQWSIVYDLKHRRAELAMGHQYDEVFTFDLSDLDATADGT